MQPSLASQRGAIHPPARESVIPERPAMRPAMRRPGSLDGVVRVAKSSVEPVTPPATSSAPVAPVFTPSDLPMPPTVPINDIIKTAPAPVSTPTTPATPAAPAEPAKTDLKDALPTVEPAKPLNSFGSNTVLRNKKWLLIAGASIIVIIIGLITVSIL